MAISLSLQAAELELWSDPNLPVKDSLELWLDASREGAARQSRGRATLTHRAPVDLWHDASGHGRHLHQTLPDRRPHFIIDEEIRSITFDGTDDFLQAVNLHAALRNGTIFLVGGAGSNSGGFRGFMALSANGKNDYTAGLNLDLGPFNSTRLAFFNAEGSGMNGAFNFLKDGFPFGAA